MAGGQNHLVIVGGGPAGMVAGLLFARAGVKVTVLEKHGDFLRDFRGDTVHPSTLRIFSELGLLDRLLERPHDKVHDIQGLIGGRRLASEIVFLHHGRIVEHTDADRFFSGAIGPEAAAFLRGDLLV